MIVSLNDYQDKCVSMGIFPDNVWDVYLPLKLVGEAGEVAEKFGKFHRGDGPLNTKEVGKELGDVLWYAAVLAKNLGYTLEEIADMNISKLEDRAVRGVLRGNGDNR